MARECYDGTWSAARSSRNVLRAARKDILAEAVGPIEANGRFVLIRRRSCHVLPARAQLDLRDELVRT